MIGEQSQLAKAASANRNGQACNMQHHILAVVKNYRLSGGDDDLEWPATMPNRQLANSINDLYATGVNVLHDNIFQPRFCRRWW